VDVDVAQAMTWFRKSAARGHPLAVHALQSGGIPGESLRQAFDNFKDAISAAPRHKIAHRFAEAIREGLLAIKLQESNDFFHESGSIVPHQSPRDSLWVQCMMGFGIVSEEELELAKRIYAYSLRICAFCGSTSAPLANCPLCMECRYCIAMDCQLQHWNKEPAAESHKVLCPRIYVRGSKGRIRRRGRVATTQKFVTHRAVRVVFLKN
jgi:hypothetical protein